MDFTGKTAIVTGGASGIGKRCCEMLSKWGANVVVADIDMAKASQTADAIRKSGGSAVAFEVDLSSVAQISAMVDYAVDTYGALNILVNNAGILHATPIEYMTEEEWDLICTVNLKAVFFACQCALPFFKQAGGGKIVNMASLAGRNGGIETGLAYTAAKAGVIGLTRGMATRLAKLAINCNAVCPGTTETAILNSLDSEKIDKLRSMIPLGRLGHVDDVANAVCFLCSKEAAFITGVVLDVNGGLYIG